MTVPFFPLFSGLFIKGQPRLFQARRTLFVAGTAHALHDGYTDLIFVLLPVWQAEFSLSYGVLALLRGLGANHSGFLLCSEWRWRPLSLSSCPRSNEHLPVTHIRRESMEGVAVFQCCS
jgi:hypothetical protein